MKTTIKNFFITLSLLSFVVITTQFVLSAFLRVYLKLPYLSITFAFLGLSSAGLYVFLKYDNASSEKMSWDIPSYIHSYGILLLCYFSFFSQTTIAHQVFSLNEIFSNSQIPPEHVMNKYLSFILAQSLITGLYFSVCFFYIGLAISLIYKIYATQSPKLYYFDLLGATIGCVLGSLLMQFMDIYFIPMMLAIICFALAFYLKKKFAYCRSSQVKSLIFIIISIVFLLSNFPMTLANIITSQKRNSQELWVGWNTYSRVALVQDKTPKGVVYKFAIDNGMGNAILDSFNLKNPFEKELFHEFSATSLGFLMKQPKDVLILFAGAGRDMLEAYSYSKGKADITGVEINPLIVNKARSLLPFHLKEFFALDNVHMVVKEGRSFLETTNKKYDTVVYSWAGSPINNYLGINANSGQYLYTKEAFAKLLDVLKDDGTFGIVNGSKLRILAALRVAFGEMGISNIENHIALLAAKDSIKNDKVFSEMLSPFDNAYLIVKKSPFTIKDRDLILANIEKMGLGPIYIPYHTLPMSKTHSYIHQIILKILESKNPSRLMNDLSRDLLLNLTILTDDKPFLNNSFYFNSLFDPVFWGTLGTNFSKLYTKHFMYHLFTLFFIFIITSFGIAGFVVMLYVRKRTIIFSRDMPYLFYFACLGFAFMLVEISLLNQYMLYLSNPIYTLSVILSGILFSLGLGSYISDTLIEKCKLTLKINILICSTLLLINYFFLPLLIKATLGYPLLSKFCLVFLDILPLGLFLGVLFPQGLKKLASDNNHLIPLAWGLNGFMSVISSAGSIYLSTIMGFRCFLLIAAIMYLFLLIIPMQSKRITE